MDLIWLRPGGSEPWIPVSLRALASVAGRGKDVAAYPWGQGTSPGNE